MTLDDYWLDDGQMGFISREVPSTAWGRELMTTAWPSRYGALVSSETYRGCAMVLSALHAGVHHTMRLDEIEGVIENVDEGVKTSASFPAGSDRLGGAVLTVTNAWEGAHSGISAAQLVAALESERIYAARMFCLAREQEAAGNRLP